MPVQQPGRVQQILVEAIRRSGVCVGPQLPPYPALMPEGVSGEDLTRALGAVVHTFAQQSARRGGSQQLAIFQGATATAKALPGPAGAIAEVVDAITGVFKGLFGKNLCRPKDPCRSQRFPDGRVYRPPRTGRKCCLINPLGWGVLVIERAVKGDEWPLAYEEVAAGDYFTTNRGNRDEMHRKYRGWQPDPAVFRGRDYWFASLMVPDGWKVKLYDQPEFDGKSLELGPGFHNLEEKGWHKARVKSMQVRGWWTWADSLNFKWLAEKRPGWLTARLPEDLDRDTERDLLAGLLLSDPCRRPAPASLEIPILAYASFWRPGWQGRYLKLQRAIQQIQYELRRRGVGARFPRMGGWPPCPPSIPPL